MKVVARSASDRTDDWPFWMVWDGYVNVTNKVVLALVGGSALEQGIVLVPRELAEHLAEAWNAWGTVT